MTDTEYKLDGIIIKKSQLKNRFIAEVSDVTLKGVVRITFNDNLLVIK